MGSKSVFQFTWMLIIAFVILKCITDIEYNQRNSFMMQKERKLWAEKQIQNQIALSEANTKSIRLEMANVAHDLRNPLQAFSAGMQYIGAQVSRESCALNTEVVKEIMSTINEMQSSSEFMNVKINRFIDISKSDNNIELKPRRGSFKLLQSIQWAIGVMTSFNKSLNISLDDSSSSIIATSIISDKVWFEENLLCYISNAVKHTPPHGKITVRCYLSSESSSPDSKMFLTVEVEDSGIGIDPKMHKVLFKPFTQAQSSAGGIGLGLYSLAFRVSALRGTYGCRNNENGIGSCFYFTMPYTPDDESTYHDIMSEESEHDKNVVKDWTKTQELCQ